MSPTGRIENEKVIIRSTTQPSQATPVGQPWFGSSFQFQEKLNLPFLALWRRAVWYVRNKSKAIAVTGRGGL
jgi:hypothetical protein